MINSRLAAAVDPAAVVLLRAVLEAAHVANKLILAPLCEMCESYGTSTQQVCTRSSHAGAVPHRRWNMFRGELLGLKSELLTLLSQVSPLHHVHAGPGRHLRSRCAAQWLHDCGEGVCPGWEISENHFLLNELHWCASIFQASSSCQLYTSLRSRAVWPHSTERPGCSSPLPPKTSSRPSPSWRKGWAKILPSMRSWDVTSNTQNDTFRKVQTRFPSTLCWPYLQSPSFSSVWARWIASPPWPPCPSSSRTAPLSTPISCCACSSTWTKRGSSGIALTGSPLPLSTQPRPNSSTKTMERGPSTRWVG